MQNARKSNKADMVAVLNRALPTGPRAKCLLNGASDRGPERRDREKLFPPGQGAGLWRENAQDFETPC